MLYKQADDHYTLGDETTSGAQSRALEQAHREYYIVTPYHPQIVHRIISKMLLPPINEAMPSVENLITLGSKSHRRRQYLLIGDIIRNATSVISTNGAQNLEQ